MERTNALADMLRGLVRDPYQSEHDFFRGAPHVGGMATEDGRITLNPYSPLNAREREAVTVNEGARLVMSRYGQQPPALTQAQSSLLSTIDNGRPYGGGNDNAQRETIIARILSGDPTAGDWTQDQANYASKIKGQMPGLLSD
jgi:hypothetical protein